jgi:hypothetical protein
MLLSESWAGLFREHILPELPVHKLARFFTEDFGRLTKELYASLGSLILQQMHDLTGEETVSQFSFNIQWPYALDIPGESDESRYLSPKTLWRLRHLVMKEKLDVELFNQTTETLAKAFHVDTTRQRLDSVHIRSNMRRLGRIGIFSKSIHTFLINLKRRHSEIFETKDDQPADVAVKSPREVPADSLQNPSDPDAGYSGHKGQGYQAQVMETCCDSDDDSLRAKTLNLRSPMWRWNPLASATSMP